jgi:subtilisin family serine protease
MKPAGAGGFVRELVVRDHGSLITSLVHDRAPKAELSVYRVLDDKGIGDMDLVGHAMSAAFLKAGGRPLVLNLSLGMGPPPVLLTPVLTNAQHAFKAPGNWSMMASQLLTTNPTQAMEDAALADPTMMAIKHLFTFKPADNVLPVAAAGNDSARDLAAGAPQPDPNGGLKRFIACPRFPAILQDTLGVSSMVQPGTFSDFSNNDDTVVPRGDDGVSAIGENVIGPHTEFGWARWDGTSFATPVASGFAAALWSRNPKLKAPDIMNGVVYDRAGNARECLP